MPLNALPDVHPYIPSHQTQKYSTPTFKRKTALHSRPQRMSPSKDRSRPVTLDRVKVSAPKNSLIWKDFGVFLDKKLAWRLDSEFNSSVLANVLSDSSYLLQVVQFQICLSCLRPIGEDSLASHYSRCLEMKQKRTAADAAISAATGPSKRKRGRAANALLDVEPSSMDLSRGTTPAPDTPVSGSLAPQGRPKKKYKKSQMQKEKEAANAAAAAAAAAEAAAARATSGTKRKKQPKTKTQTKTKGPVDVERQCGVPLPLGGFCARLLTCKTHSMGAKRAVPGRSAPYDVLLQQYQKRNQAKIAASHALAAQRRENAQLTGMDNDENTSLNMVLDPDEETHLVLEGLLKNYAIPLERKVILPARHRLRFLYMREAYANALITAGNAGADSQALALDLTLATQAISGLIGGLQGRCALVNVDLAAASTQTYAAVTGELYQVRAPLKAILMTAQYNQQQQQLFQQQVMKLQQQQLLMKQRQSQQAGQGQGHITNQGQISNQGQAVLAQAL